MGSRWRQLKQARDTQSRHAPLPTTILARAEYRHALVGGAGLFLLHRNAVAAARRAVQSAAAARSARGRLEFPLLLAPPLIRAVREPIARRHEETVQLRRVNPRISRENCNCALGDGAVRLVAVRGQLVHRGLSSGIDFCAHRLAQVWRYAATNAVPLTACPHRCVVILSWARPGVLRCASIRPSAKNTRGALLRTLTCRRAGADGGRGLAVAASRCSRHTAAAAGSHRS